MSSSGHWATSRRISWPSDFLTARWPPFLSASVRRVTSMTKGAPLSANQRRKFMSSWAPRLSELETKAYLTPSASRRSSQPDPSRAGYRSPWPGGHHSSSGCSGQLAGERPSARILGTRFCISSTWAGSAKPSAAYFPGRPACPRWWRKNSSAEGAPACRRWSADASLA